MPKVTIDGMDIKVEKGTTVLQAAEKLGIEIPRFCYHGKLSSPSNCRMCMVEIEGCPRLAPSCSRLCEDKMVVTTNSEKVKEARKSVMEFLLINHPLDCPVCDQGGACDLQDQAFGYGNDRSRYDEDKRIVKEKDLGPLIKTAMTRCINCTRCVRFGEEIAGVEELGLIGRGETAEIGTYIKRVITSELSGNMIDVCPVGALTNKPSAFKFRPWELNKTDGIDVLDAVGSNISIQSRDNEVMRILPRMNDDVNECWISDKTRFAIDGLKNQRLDRPYIRNEEGVLEDVSWEEALKAIKKKIKGKKIGAVVGDLADCESIIALKDLADEIECRQDEVQFDASKPAGYRFNTTIAGIEEADAILLIGTNPRIEAAMINARIYKNYYKNKNLPIAVIGESMKLNYPYTRLGINVDPLIKLTDGKGDFAKVFSKAKKPMVILGAGALHREDGVAIQALVRKLTEKYPKLVTDKWNGFNMLHTAASRVGALELGCTSKKSLCEILNMDVLYLLGADEINVDKIGNNTFVIYQGHHGDKVAKHAHVVLSGVAYTEKNGTYVNTEGRPQQSIQAVKPTGQAKEDWQIIRAVAECKGKKLPYSTLVEVRERLVKENKIFKTIGEVKPARWVKFAKKGIIDTTSFRLPINNFYRTDPISRASETMKQCTEKIGDV